MKLLAGLLLSLALVGCAVNTPRVASGFQTLNDVSYAITDAEGQTFCSTTKIGYETFLTAAHCVTDEARVHIRDHDGKVFKAFIVRQTTEHDLAILEAAIYGPSVKVGDTPLLWSDVFTVGFPLGVGKFLTEGKWQGELLAYGGEKVFYGLVSSPIAPGNSGGGVFQRQGDRWVLVGVAQAVPITAIGGFIPNMVLHIGLVSHPQILKDFISGKTYEKRP